MSHLRSLWSCFVLRYEGGAGTDDNSSCSGSLPTPVVDASLQQAPCPQCNEASERTSDSDSEQIQGGNEGVSPDHKTGSCELASSEGSTCIEVCALVSKAASHVPVVSLLRENLRLDFTDLEFCELIHRGSRKDVYLGSWAETRVTIICERDEGVAPKVSILQDMDNHPNIVQFYRWAVDSSSREYTIMEFAPHGTLHELLVNEGLHLGTKCKTGLCEQICSAMCELTKQGVLHRNLTAMNVLVSSKDPLHVKVSGFEDAVLMRSNSGLDEPESPSRPSSDSVSSPSSPTGEGAEETDICAFGVVMWEVFSNGAVPFPDMSGLEATIHQGVELPAPADCPATVYALMSSCWKSNVWDRPTFFQLAAKFKRLQAMNSERDSSFLEKINEEIGAAFAKQLSGFELARGQDQANARRKNKLRSVVASPTPHEIRTRFAVENNSSPPIGFDLSASSLRAGSDAAASTMTQEAILAIGRSTEPSMDVSNSQYPDRAAGKAVGAEGDSAKTYRAGVELLYEESLSHLLQTTTLCSGDFCLATFGLQDSIVNELSTTDSGVLSSFPCVMANDSPLHLIPPAMYDPTLKGHRGAISMDGEQQATGSNDSSNNMCNGQINRRAWPHHWPDSARRPNPTCKPFPHSQPAPELHSAKFNRYPSVSGPFSMQSLLGALDSEVGPRSGNQSHHSWLKDSGSVCKVQQSTDSPYVDIRSFVTDSSTVPNRSLGHYIHIGTTPPLISRLHLANFHEQAESGFSWCTGTATAPLPVPSGYLSSCQMHLATVLRDG
eukprot:gene10032-7922_t